MFCIPSFSGFKIPSGNIPLLLDAYPGAAVAFSLDKLRTLYTGNAIRVRRASDNTEQNIGFVNNVLDVSTLQSFCSGTDGFVAAYYDQSGNARDVSQSTASKQPQIVSSGSVLLKNGKPCIIFDETKAQEFRFASTVNIGTSGSLFTVVEINGTTGFGALMGTLTLSGYMYHVGIGGFGYFTTGYNGVVPVVRNSQKLISLLNDSTNLLGYENGVLKNSRTITNTSTINTLGIFGVFAGQTFGGIAQELVLFPNYETANRGAIETNIKNRYNIS